MNFKYVNSIGESIDLSTFPYALQSDSILDYSWNYESSDIGNNRAKITRFYKEVTEIPVQIAIYAEDNEEYIELLNKFFVIVEKDIVTNTAGKLFCDDSYLTCYIRASSKAQWKNGIRFCTNDITIVTEYPFWVTETVKMFRASGISGTKMYEYSYPYTYGGIGKQNITLINSHYANTDFKIILYGSAANPSISIGGHVYQVNTTIAKGELLEIDSIKGTIYKVTQKGQRINQFNERRKDSDIFEKIPPGTSYISWNGDFDFDITLYEERSEPKWSL